MSKRRRLAVLLVSGLGLVAAGACTDLSYNCAGICGTVIGNGDFEGVVSANSVAEAVSQCNQLCGCDAGTSPPCSCYEEE